MRTRDLTFCGLLAALTAVFAQILLFIPISPVPVNLAILIPLLSGRLLGIRRSVVSQMIYLLMGIIGLPVFAAMRGGVVIVVGPTGGYLLGYLLIALITGQRKCFTKQTYMSECIVMSLATLSCYVCGTIWFMLISGNGLFSSLALCVFPFIPGDVLKVLAGAYLVKKLRPIFKMWE